MPDRLPSSRARRRLAAVAAALLLATTAADVLADPPAPASDRDSRRHSEDRRDDERRDRPERREPTEEEWQQTVAFLREQAPHRLELYDELADRWQQRQQAKTDAATRPDANESRSRVRSYIFGRVRSMRELEQSDPALYDFMLGQFRLEDQMIGGLLDVRRAREAGDAAAEKTADEAVSAAIRRHVENALSERESRIERLRADLAEEEQRLEHDRDHMDDKMQRLRSRYERFVPDESPDGDRKLPSTRPSDE